VIYSLIWFGHVSFSTNDACVVHHSCDLFYIVRLKSTFILMKTYRAVRIKHCRFEQNRISDAKNVGVAGYV
jgi:hypothetical protein